MYCLASLLVSGLAIHFCGFGGPLDMKFYYSENEAIRFFGGLTGVEVTTYLRHELFDFLFLICYSALLYRTLKHLFPDQSFYRVLGIAPGVFDLIETSTITLILIGVIPAAPTWLGFMTCAKWTTFIVVASVIGIQFLRRKIARSL